MGQDKNKLKKVWTGIFFSRTISPQISNGWSLTEPVWSYQHIWNLGIGLMFNIVPEQCL